jgi:hypothetical protein
MTVSSLRFLARSGLTAASLALALIAFAAPSAFAGDVMEAGPVVTVTGDGGKVQAAGASVTVTGTAAEVKAAGAQIESHVDTTGDLDLAGAQITVTGNVGRDLNAMGASLDISGKVARNASIAGAVVKTNISVAGWFRVAGATVTLGPATDIVGSLKAGGALVTIEGHVGGNVQAGGGVVTFNGIADGPVDIAAHTVVIGPNARIAGDLTVRSTNPPQIATTAVVSGTVKQIEPPTWVPVAPWVWVLGFAAAIAVGTILGGLVLLLFGGHVFGVATEHVRHRPLSSFLFGILTFVLVPFVAVILMVTIVGISVGFAVLLLLPFLIVFGHAVAAAGIAGAVLMRRPGEVGPLLGFLMLVVGAIILVLIGLIPWVGPALVGIAIILGTGAFTRTLGHRLRRADPRLPI